MIQNKRIEWNEEKNHFIQEQRGLNFEAILIAIEQGNLIDIVENSSPNYEGQRILVVDIDDYLVLVPFVEDLECIFLKTAFKSRKATRDYLRRLHNDEEAIVR